VHVPSPGRCHEAIHGPTVKALEGAEPKPYMCFHVGVRASRHGQAQCPDDQSVQQNNVSPKLAIWARGFCVDD
jgi:hypothetical protein